METTLNAMLLGQTKKNRDFIVGLGLASPVSKGAKEKGGKAQLKEKAKLPTLCSTYRPLSHTALFTKSLHTSRLALMSSSPGFIERPALQNSMWLNRIGPMATRHFGALPKSGGQEGGSGAAVLERRALRVQPPRMHQVVLLNDDYTPMEFVVVVIQEFFNKDRDTATQIMLKIHLDGKAVCGVYTKDVACTKAQQVVDAARKAGHPLQCVSEPI